LSSADTTEAPAGELERDDAREAVVERFRSELGDAVVGAHVRPGHAVWVRVDRGAWREAARFARDGLHCAFFDFLSAIDWLPSPFGRDMDSQEDRIAAGDTDGSPAEPTAIVAGAAGGDTRFQLLARVYAPTTGTAVILKADVPDDDLSIDSWVPVYAGANWHERETWEMFGIDFVGHPGLTHIYLPGQFEGHPLRKDFPLLARRVKPWPGIVDVEPMPGGAGEGEGGEE